MNKNKRLWIILGTMLVLFVVGGLVYRSISTDQATQQANESSSISQAEVEVDVSSEQEEEAETSVEMSEDVEESQEEEEAEASTEESTKASAENGLPTTQVPNTHLIIDGEEKRLHDLLGKPMIINLWASWCPPCREEMPAFQANYDEYSEDVNFVMLQATDSRNTETIEAGLAFAEEMGLTMPVYHDVDFENQIVFGVNMLPMTIVLDEDGMLVDIVRGMVSQAKLQSLIEQTLN